MSAFDPQIYDLLEEKYLQFNRPGFVEDDPVSIPHLFDNPRDIELSGFLTALIAWGKRSTIINNANKWMQWMEMDPHDFLLNRSEYEWGRFESFVHRTFNGTDCIALLKSLRNVYQQYGSLEALFQMGMDESSEDVQPAIIQARKVILEFDAFPPRTHKHIANPARGSSAKRINMFLRWMVRKDQAGVDFGIWEGFKPSQLICPLDVHTGNVSRKLGLLDRKQNDWKAAKKLTDTLKVYDAKDPVKYDFSLFGLGVYDHF